jgi:hypothetical protein
MAILTVKNRWHEPFIGMFDGETYVVKDTLAVPEHIALHLKRQSIIRDNPVNPGTNDYRLGIVERNDVLTPLSEIPAESLDRTDMDDFRKVVIKPSGIRQAPPVPKASPGQNVHTTE